MAANCSRVTASSGPKAPVSYPATIPWAAAQFTAPAYHASAATSVKPAPPGAAGLPARFQSTCAVMARVSTAPGSKVTALVPSMRPFSYT